MCRAVPTKEEQEAVKTYIGHLIGAELPDIYSTQHDLPYIRHSQWHFNCSSHSYRFQILIFYDTKATLESVLQSPQPTFLKAEVPPRIKDHFSNLSETKITVKFSSLEEVQKMGGWYSYYK